MTPYKSGQVLTVNGKPEKQPEPRSYDSDVVFWESIRDARDPELYQAYLMQFPDGAFAALAKIYLQRKVEPMVKVERIVDVVCSLSGITLAEMKSPKRKNKIVRPRQVLMYLLSSMTVMSTPQIGALLGGRDHSTIIYGRRLIDRMLADGIEPETTKLVNRALALAKAQPEASA